MVPGAGACSRAMPSPVISTWSPVLPACSMISRIGRPTRDGTRSFPALAMTTVFAGDDGADSGCDGAGALGEGPEAALALGAGEFAACDDAGLEGEAALSVEARSGSSLGRSLAAS